MTLNINMQGLSNPVLEYQVWARVFLTQLGETNGQMLDAACPPDGRRGYWMLDQ